ncbi:aromatic ring-hydroxylating oxygenase subunit alpha [Acuticoccus mangrovi]|uniref:Rieske 2Fe-2S domain-containing protein n=1 Tax=Acuticoccus mangrovi TaxID=2796142 RepID=A0A934ISS9_9HYPH|nr:aromatic ring-hydroxylating dioxygenase subunit alpha [Acuticoccus mangrovi]MBJ3778131.1 Rieske 2Fe-2S domain-containing protein [Acuticoccus mangrovi]
MTRPIEQLIRRGAIHRDVYCDPAVFDREMTHIFDRTWVFLAHESEIPSPGDYKTTTIGRHPVIVNRNDEGEIGAFINRCRHRGPTVCRNELGNAKFFRCPYHAWTYNNAGELVGVPMPQGYGADFDKSRLGLVHVARVASYAGFIFGSMSAHGPTLEDHLGGVRKFLDAYVATSPTGEIGVYKGYQKCVYSGNWKFQLENGVDPYHVGALHASAVTPEALAIYRQGKGAVIAMDGHGVTDHTDWGPMPVDASLSGGFNLVIFPNLIVLRSQIRTVRPIAVDRTEIITSVVKLKGVDEAVNLQRMRDQEFEFGAAGTFFADDLDIFERTQQGLNSSAVDWLEFSRGLDREEMRNGYMHGFMSDETQHRGMYANWMAMMTAATPGIAEAAE